MKRTDKALFAADSICKSFGDKVVLKGASAWGWPGRVTALLGRNGSGKSTLLKGAIGAIKIDYGAVHIDGKAYDKPRLHILARHGVYYAADYGGIPLDATLRAMLGAIEAAFGTSTGAAAAGALGLTEFLDQPVLELSGGECKRAEIAIAMTRKPRCLLADEPFAGVSPLDAERIAAGIKALCDDGCAVIMTGHEIPNIMDIADEIVWVTSGTTHAIGSPEQASTHYQFCTEYLGAATRHARA
jgi:ABC-type multidrug transport system ATPase subunit